MQYRLVFYTAIVYKKFSSEVLLKRKQQACRRNCMASRTDCYDIHIAS